MSEEIGFAEDIRPLFTAEDVSAMRRMGLNLASVEQVRKNAPRILSRLSDKSMPPGRPWPDEQVARFRAWIDGGMAS